MARALVLAGLTSLLLAGAPGAAPGRDSKNAGLIVYWSESPWPSIWSVRPDGSHRHRILRNQQNAKRPRLSPDRRWVAFDGASPGKAPLSDFDIQIVHPDGSGLRTITRSRQWDVDAHWSPDGTRLSFSRLPPYSRDEHAAFLWIVNRDGSGLRRVARGFGARWSPDGTKILYSAGFFTPLLVMDANGAHKRAVTTFAASEPDWR